MLRRVLVGLVVHDVALASGVRREALEMVDIATVDPTIVIDLRYATEQNVTGHALYPRGTRAMVLPSVAQQLAGAQAWLKQFRYRLKIWDAYRPKASARAALEICREGSIRL